VVNKKELNTCTSEKSFGNGSQKYFICHFGYNYVHKKLIASTSKNEIKITKFVLNNLFWRILKYFDKSILYFNRKSSLEANM
jgi:hypothetical protein